MYGYNSNYYSGTSNVGMAVVGVVIGMILVYLLIIGFAIANYVMTSIGLQSIASRRQIKNPWMAWLPFARNYLVGSIADEYDGRNGFRRKWRVVLLTLSLIVLGLVIAMYISIFVSFFSIAFKVGYSNIVEPGDIIGLLLAIYIPIIILAMVAMAQSFCYAICIYKIFESTVPEKSIKYLLIYLLVPLGGAICLMRCKDKGYSVPVPSVPPMSPVPPVSSVPPVSPMPPVPPTNQETKENQMTDKE